MEWAHCSYFNAFEKGVAVYLLILSLKEIAKTKENIQNNQEPRYIRFPLQTQEKLPNTFLFDWL